jgi:hypothetical protein
MRSGWRELDFIHAAAQSISLRTDAAGLITEEGYDKARGVVQPQFSAK